MYVINIRRDQLKSTSTGIIIVIHLKYRLYLMSFIPIIIIIYLFIFLCIKVPIIIFSKYAGILLLTQYWDEVYKRIEVIYYYIKTTTITMKLASKNIKKIKNVYPQVIPLNYFIIIRYKLLKLKRSDRFELLLSPSDVVSVKQNSIQAGTNLYLFEDHQRQEG